MTGVHTARVPKLAGDDTKPWSVSMGNVWNIFDGKRWCFKLLIRCACGSTIGCFSLDLASNREMIGDDWR